MTNINNDGWIEWTWTEDKPYPETLDTVVDVKFRDGTCRTDRVAWWYDPNVKYSSWHLVGDTEDIIAYRFCKLIY